MFDHKNLEVGKLYPMRNGGKAEYLKPFIGSTGEGDERLAWLRHFNDGTQMLFDTTRDGNSSKFIIENSSMDIMSDEPIREPVEVALTKRFLNVYCDGTTGGTHVSEEEAVKNRLSMTKCIGTYELPAVIKVQPV